MAVQVQIKQESGGFSDKYPLARTVQNGKENILRPLKNPLYDTENIATSGNGTSIAFFSRPLSTLTVTGSINKTFAETNLSQSGQISFPLMFAIAGFNFETQPGTSLADWRLIYVTCFFQFSFTGNRPYLTVPLTRIPAGVSPEGFAAADGATAAVTYIEVHNGIGHIENIYGFTVLGGTLLIQNGEAFGATINWSAAQTPAAAVRVRVYVIGILYNAI